MVADAEIRCFQLLLNGFQNNLGDKLSGMCSRVVRVLL